MFSQWAGLKSPLLRLVRRDAASHGYVVAAPYHDRANTYNSNIVYLANKLGQRPLDVSFDITALLNDPVWGSHIDDGRIGIAAVERRVRQNVDGGVARPTTSKRLPLSCSLDFTSCECRTSPVNRPG
jgi:hypothetical protein